MPKQKYYYRKGKGGKKIRCKMPSGKKAKDTKEKRKKSYDPYRTYESGGRVEAYTFGEAQSSKSWP